MEIPRIALPATQEFNQNIIHRHKAVVITDLFAGEPIRTISTKEAAIGHLGDMLIPLDNSYDDAVAIEDIRQHLANRLPAQFRPGKKDDGIPHYAGDSIRLREYFYYACGRKNRHLLRIAFKTSAPWQRFFTPPAFTRPIPGESPELLNHNFIGIKGSFSNIHFDKDGLHALLYSVYGRKRLIVFPPEASAKLAPISQFSSWSLQNFSEDDRRRFLEYTGGCEVILEPGEALYFPPFAWHYADYLDDCWSLNLRFRRSNVITRLLNATYPDCYCQGLAQLLCSPDLSQARREKILEEALNPEQDNTGLNRIQSLCRHYGLPIGRAPLLVDIASYIPDPLPKYRPVNRPESLLLK
ncbi:cupin-like domain-containing protein [Biostraticola tofi]|uniref:Lysine-specific demethylase 8 n=1 Tax=Biostraticola tofi TaxID=466109 RepID=A0A4R3YTK1_9GAMM|nr:cupin-like domain-containing protein [Biostraticola tofi]TCV94463.1 lysine-specific demethylase 8 [Biostraticola tofi]